MTSRIGFAPARALSGRSPFIRRESIPVFLDLSPMPLRGVNKPLPLLPTDKPLPPVPLRIVKAKSLAPAPVAPAMARGPARKSILPQLTSLRPPRTPIPARAPQFSFVMSPTTPTAFKISPNRFSSLDRLRRAFSTNATPARPRNVIRRRTKSLDAAVKLNGNEDRGGGLDARLEKMASEASALYRTKVGPEGIMNALVQDGLYMGGYAQRHNDVEPTEMHLRWGARGAAIRQLKDDADHTLNEIKRGLPLVEQFGIGLQLARNADVTQFGASRINNAWHPALAHVVVAPKLVDKASERVRALLDGSKSLQHLAVELQSFANELGAVRPNAVANELLHLARHVNHPGLLSKATSTGRMFEYLVNKLRALDVPERASSPIGDKVVMAKAFYLTKQHADFDSFDDASVAKAQA